MTAPWENPARTSRSGGTPTSASAASTQPLSRSNVGQERGRIGEADLAHDVPVRAARRERQRAAREDGRQAPARVELVGERLEVVLVGAAPVDQDEQRPPARRRPAASRKARSSRLMRRRAPVRPQSSWKRSALTGAWAIHSPSPRAGDPGERPLLLNIA